MQRQTSAAPNARAVVLQWRRVLQQREDECQETVDILEECLEQHPMLLGPEGVEEESNNQDGSCRVPLSFEERRRNTQDFEKMPRTRPSLRMPWDQGPTQLEARSSVAASTEPRTNLGVPTHPGSMDHIYLPQ